MSLGDIFEKVKEIFTGHPDDSQPDNVRPASEDPMGDPADGDLDNTGSPQRYAHEDRVGRASRKPRFLRRSGGPGRQHLACQPGSTRGSFIPVGRSTGNPSRK